jgi:hypothetical protein
MRQTTRSLGEGLFEARAPKMRSSAFGPLAETLNGMAERVQRLIATQKELSSAISHELRTPIARMRFALEMLADTDDSHASASALWRDDGADLDELDGLIDSSLTYARFEREQPEPHLSTVDIAPWLEEQVERPIACSGVIFDLQVDISALPPAAACRTRLPQHAVCRHQPTAQCHQVRPASHPGERGGRRRPDRAARGRRRNRHSAGRARTGLLGLYPARSLARPGDRRLRPRAGDRASGSGTARRHGQRRANHRSAAPASPCAGHCHRASPKADAITEDSRPVRPYHCG